MYYIALIIDFHKKKKAIIILTRIINVMALYFILLYFTNITKKLLVL